MANNPYNNKVALSDGTTLIDLSTDTAVATDVASGKYFHLATGQRVSGLLSFVTYYTGSSDPSSGTGSNGDIYLKVTS